MLKGLALGVKLENVDSYTFSNEMIELNNLAKACDISIVETVSQELDKFNPLSYVGSGKVIEIANICKALDIDVIVCNDELSPVQIKALSDATDILIYDRTYLILEIFRSRAKTRESIIQVQIAAIRYMMPRLSSLRDGFSRQRGAGGAAHGKGAGETQLELDRRINADRIVALKKELNELVKSRRTHRLKRKNSEIKNVCLVGYTNSGKSTLMNTFLRLSKNYQEEKEVFNKNMLFATLETSSRRLEFSNSSLVLTDTVGFIEKLPHELVEAFKSTLEEICEADLLIHVVDATNKECVKQIETTNKVLSELGACDIPVIYAFNKIDNMDDGIIISNEYKDAIRISAKENINIEYLYQMIQNKLYESYVDTTLFFPYENQSDFYKLKEITYVLTMDKLDDGILATVKANDLIINKYSKYIKK